MCKINNKLKAFVLSWGMVAAMALPLTVSAQGVFGDLLDNYYLEMEQDDRGALQRGNSRSEINISTQGFGSDEYGGFNIGTQLFGQEAPLGGGCLVLAFAGVAYAFKKRKNNNKK
jgi:hypothetical protein